MKRIYFLTLAFLTVFSVASQKDAASPNDSLSTSWDVSTPQLPYKEIDISVEEGTWMNLDVSPDGSTIVFDLLGDIFSMPIAGGEATLLRGGHAFEVQPRFSPDGSHISFTSDAGGGDNIWIMSSDGEDAKQITKEDFRLVNNAVWSADGNYLYCKKHFSSERSLGAGEIWMYHKTGGKGIQLTEKKNEQQDVGEPWASPDGIYVYYSEDVYPGGFFQYNKDPNSQIYVINRYNLKEGKNERVTGGAGGAIRPVISHNGTTMAFIKRVREKSVLYLHDLSTGREWPVYDQLSKDQQEAWAIFGPFTGFNFTPDDQSIIIWSQGKIKKINLSTSEVVDIPFRARANHKIVNALKFKNKAFVEKFTAKAIRNAVTSPDGKTLVFNAAGYLWKKSLPDGKPKRLTDGRDLEYEPSFSKDGKHLVYVTWNDDESGSLQRISMTSSKAKPIKLSQEKGIYREPSFSPVDNDMIVFRKEGGNQDQGMINTKNPGIYTLHYQNSKKSEAKSNEVFITDQGQFPSFNKDGSRIYFQTGGYLFGSLTKTLKSVNLSGKDEQELVSSKYGQRIIPSPDDEWVAFSNLYKVFIAPLPKTGKTVELDGKSTSVPVVQFTKDAGVNLHWSADSKKLNWTLGDALFSNALDQRFLFLEGAPTTSPPLDSIGTVIDLQLESDRPEGLLAIKGGRIITMEDDQVIEDGVILIEDNKIVKLGSQSEIAIPNKATIIDAEGKTIMPGLIDVHAHLGHFRHGITAQKKWSYYANLAYGVTTTHDPSANTEMVFSLSEMVKSGHMVGPRVFSTGVILYGADGDFKASINNLEDARSAIRRTKAFGAFSVKSYNQPRRNQRQQVIKAAAEESIEVVPEGGSTFFHNMSMILDGHTGIEHNIPIATLHDDVIQLWAGSQTGYTPTLIVNYGGLNGEYFWYQKHNVWENEKLLKYTPRSVIDSRSRHRTMVPEGEYENGHMLVSKSVKSLSDAGVKVNLGAHGQLQGLGAHWELWMLSQGGMTNMQALQAATINGASYLGMEDEIGSLKEGKLADLIILDKNPLEDIMNSDSVIFTMINGRLYDTSTMNEVGNYNKPRGSFYWEKDGYAPSFDWHGVSKVKCSCEIGHQ